jgi:hypothetical protein
MKYLTRLLALASVLLLVACGGGGGCTVTPFGNFSTSNSCGSAGSTTSAVASLSVALDKTTISNAGGDKALLTVTVLDASRNVISGVAVSVSVDTGIYTPITTTTDAAGQITGNIAIGSVKGNRNITAIVAASGVSGSVVVGVTGSKISLTPVPGAPAAGASVSLTVKATDANGAGIGGASITLSGANWVIPAPVLTTDNSGTAVTTITAPGVTGVAALTATGLGVSNTNNVSVGVAGGVPVATPTGAVSPSLSINPNTIGTNAAGATANRANLKALFLDSTNQPVPNIRVRFELDPIASPLGAGEAISTGTNTVYADLTGVAMADYIAGTRSSPTNGVHIRACWGVDDTTIALGACPNAVQATLTVNGQPLSITVGDNNLLARGNLSLTYIKNLVVQVNDSSGAAIPNALVSASVDITHYGKGFGYNDPYYINSLTTLFPTPPNISLVNAPGQLNVTDAPVLGTPGKRVWCMNEDRNRNGNLDPGEDINNNGLEPAAAEVLVSFVNGNTTAADGTLALQVQYPMNQATWLAYTVKVSTGVTGSQGTAQKSFVTGYIVDDEATGSFRTPPYGVNNCQTAN